MMALATSTTQPGSDTYPFDDDGQAVCDRMQNLPDGAWIRDEPSTFPYVFLNQHAPDEFPLQNAFRVATILNTPSWSVCGLWFLAFGLRFGDQGHH